MTGRTWISGALFVLSGLMLLGFLRSSQSITSPSTIVALLIVVVLPAVAGVALLRGLRAGEDKRRSGLRQRTIEAEVMKLAIQQGGKLTVLEVSTALALPEDETKLALDAMLERELADIEITDEGVIVYTFDSAKRLGTKHTSKGILDA